MSKASRYQGFSLIELVIVVVIIGIIGAIAIPRISRGAAGAADAKLVADLAVLRNAVDLYHTEHNGKFPTGASFVNQMTQFSDKDGNTATSPSGNIIFGPYLRKIPALSVGANEGEDGINFTGEGPGDGDGGWFYNPTTGDIRANLADTETDAAGKAYNTY